MPKRRAASRWLSPSTRQAWRTLPYSSTENIPRLPARSDRARGRHQGGTAWHRRGRDTQPTVSEGHFLTAAYIERILLGAQPRHRLMQAWLVGLQPDQEGVAGAGGGREGFFDSAGRRR